MSLLQLEKKEEAKFSIQQRERTSGKKHERYKTSENFNISESHHFKFNDDRDGKALH